MSRDKKYLIFAHKGIHDTDHENTIPAFQKILGRKNMQFCYGVSLDVQILNDDNLVCFTDFDIDGNSVYHMKQEELSKNIGYDVPHFDEALKLFMPHGNYIMNIQIKFKEGCHKNICNKVLSQIKKYHMESRCIITSTSCNIVEYVLSLENNPVGYMMGLCDDDKKYVNKLANKGLAFIVIDKDHKWLKGNDFFVVPFLTYTYFSDYSDDTELVDKCKDKVFGYITDDVKLMEECLTIEKI
jgi:glycerophosphoryl diester phosphodiesterase